MIDWLVTKEAMAEEVKHDWRKLFPANKDVQILLLRSELDSLKGMFRLNRQTRLWLAEVRIFNDRRQVLGYASDLSLKLDEAIDELFSMLRFYLDAFEYERKDMEGLGLECIGFNRYHKGSMVLEKAFSFMDGHGHTRIFMNGKMVSKNRSLIAFLKLCKNKSLQESSMFPNELRDLLIEMEN